MKSVWSGGFEITCVQISRLYFYQKTRCLIKIKRYLFDKGLLNNIKLEKDPRTIEFEKCNHSLDYTRGKAKKELLDVMPKNCTIDDREVLTSLEDSSILMRVLARLQMMSDAIDIKSKIERTVNEKCNGMQN